MNEKRIKKKFFLKTKVISNYFKIVKVKKNTIKQQRKMEMSAYHTIWRVKKPKVSPKMINNYKNVQTKYQYIGFSCSGNMFILLLLLTSNYFTICASFQQDQQHESYISKRGWKSVVMDNSEKINYAVMAADSMVAIQTTDTEDGEPTDNLSSSSDMDFDETQAVVSAQTDGTSGDGGAARWNTAIDVGVMNAVTNKPIHDISICCSEVFGSCRASCENIQLATLDINGRGIRMELKRFCPPMQLEFWNCMNNTLEAVVRGSQWSGRRCCALGLSPRCRNVCAISASSEELVNACRQSDEQHMFACFERQETGDRCCSNARTSECVQACHSIFETQTPQKSTNRRRLYDMQEMCGVKNSDVLDCVRNFTDLTPFTNSHKYLPCCDFSKSEQCRSTCRAVLNTTESLDLIIGELEAGGCGTPLPHLPLWQCFLTAERKLFVPASSSSGSFSNSNSNEVSQINQIGMDAAKLQCCEKALLAKCRRLCVQTYSSDWTATRALFESSCIMQPNELELRQCIDEVDEPCELGCDGLSFCSNFNNRPTELFRSCNSEADIAARSDLHIWRQRGYVNLPGINLPIKNITRCQPEKWTAIACTLQIKPCTRSGHFNHICREDCFQILHECMDWTRLSSALNANALCARLHPTGEDVPCVSLRPYLEASDAPQETGGHHGLTMACKGQPCNASDVCIPARNESQGYQCLPGCSLGETSNYMVPFGAYVRLAVLDMAGRNAFKVCRCAEQGRIGHCQPLPNFSHNNCMLPGGRSIKHGTSFYLECNLCSCYAEEITCTKKQCRLPGYADATYTSLPCNCPTHYVPVCAKNGNTYPSACIAKCLGFQDNEIEYGACSALNPCREGAFSCPVGMNCLEQRKICLSSMHRPCLQYQCVPTNVTCPLTRQPVCDMKGRTFATACDLLNSGAAFGHWGACFRSCSWKGPVCGINGVTYVHECAAWADFIRVDYRSRCREVGLLTNNLGRRCRTVKCPQAFSPYCRNIVPPGACCPICAGAFRSIYSRKQIDRALYALRGQHKDLLTLQSVLQALDELVQISECQLTGFLTMEVGIFVALVPRTIAPPTPIQIEACAREAEKISSLIEAQSHSITTNLVLSGLIVSHVLEPTVESSSSSFHSTLLTVSCVLIGLACWLTITTLLCRQQRALPDRPSKRRIIL